MRGSPSEAGSCSRGIGGDPSSTVAPEFAESLAARLEAMGIGMIDAPVSGGAAKAASGQMTVMAAGAPHNFAKVEDVFKAIAQKVYRLGDAPGAGSKVKMINQLLAGVHIAAAAEAMAMGIRSGADPADQMFLAAAAAGRGGEDDAAVVKNFPGIELPRKKD